MTSSILPAPASDDHLSDGKPQEKALAASDLLRGHSASQEQQRNVTGTGKATGTCGASSVPKRNHEWHQPRPRLPVCPSGRVDYYLAVTQGRLSPSQ